MTTIKKTILTEEIPTQEPEQPPPKVRRQPFWEWMAAGTPQTWKENIWKGTLYRCDPATWKRGPYLEKFFVPISLEQIKAKYGGSKYNILIGQGEREMLIYNEDFEIEGPPILAGVTHSAASAAAPDGHTAVSLKALEMISNPDTFKAMLTLVQTAAIQAMEMMRSQIPQAKDPLETLRTAKEILQPAQAAADPMREVWALLLPKLVEKLISPPDPLDQLVKIRSVLGPIAGGGSAKAELGATIVNALPTFAHHVVEGVREYRLATESNERTVELQRGVNPTHPRGPTTIDATPVTAAAPNPAQPGASAAAEPAAAAPANVVEVLAPDPRWILLQIAARVRDESYTGEDILDFLHEIQPAAITVEQLKGRSKDELLKWFAATPILNQVANNPRLPKLIDEFLAAANEPAPATTAPVN